MATAKHREPCESRGSCTVLGAPGVSPTYLSKVERDEFPPPAEDKVKAIAKIIKCDTDELLARAGRVSSDLSDIIKRRPIEVAALLRTTKGLTADDMAKLARQAQRAKDK